MYFNRLLLLLTVFSTTSNIIRAEEPVPRPGCEGLARDISPLQSRRAGKDYERSHPGSTYKVGNEAGETSALCQNGEAAGYPCRNVDLLSVMDNTNLSEKLPGKTSRLNDIWGWTHPDSGREFALVGLISGTAFVEITIPTNLIYLGGLAGEGRGSSWRDIKTMGHYAVIGSESKDHGLQIFDLEELLNVDSPKEFKTTARYTKVGNSHNIFTHEDKGFVYVVGANRCKKGLHVVDMNDPEYPSTAGCFSDDGYTHDVQCVTYKGPDSNYQGKEICFASNTDTVTIVDVTQKSNMKLISKTKYRNSAYTHQGWLTEDQRYFIFNDEKDEEKKGYNTRTHILDVSNLEKPKYKDYHDGRTKAIDHNLYVVGDYVYQANYRAGLNVLKIKDLSGSKSNKFEEAGYFDVYPSSDSANFNGAWSNYPFFPSGTIIVSGIEEGLFVLRFNPATVGKSCNMGTEKNCMLLSGCVWKDRKCTACSTFSQKKCIERGCNWVVENVDKCQSCNIKENKNDCNAMSCVWAEVDGSMVCTPCGKYTQKKSCTSAKCAWSKTKKKCSSCASFDEKKCKRNSCLWVSSDKVCSMKV